MEINKIIELIGGYKALSEILNVSKSAISNYKKRGSFPKKILKFSAFTMRSLLIKTLSILIDCISCFISIESIWKDFRAPPMKFTIIITKGNFLVNLTTRT